MSVLDTSVSDARDARSDGSATDKIQVVRSASLSDVGKLDRRKWPVTAGGDEADEKHATFRLSGERLDPEAITRATGLTPDIATRRGDPVLRGGKVMRRRRVGVWCIDSDRELSQEGIHLEDHVRWLLDLLEPVADELRRVSVEQGLVADIGCGYFTGRWNCSFDLSPETVRRIAKLDAALGFDFYVDEFVPEFRPGPTDDRHSTNEDR